MADMASAVAAEVDDEAGRVERGEAAQDLIQREFLALEAQQPEDTCRASVGRLVGPGRGGVKRVQDLERTTGTRSPDIGVEKGSFGEELYAVPTALGGVLVVIRVLSPCTRDTCREETRGLYVHIW